MRSLAQLCHRSVREGTRLALRYLDLDGFKRQRLPWTRGGRPSAVRDRRAASRLGAEERPVARLGGDEFVIAVDGFLSFAQLHALARKIVDVVGKPVEWRGASLSCSVSVGVAAYPPGTSWEALIDAADRAMYQAKTKGRGAIVVAPLGGESANSAAA